MEKTPGYYIKTFILSTMLLLESFLLTNTILEFINSQKYFSPPLGTVIAIFILLYAIIVTNALLSGAWGKWEQYLISPFPITLGMVLVTFAVNSAYAIVIAVVAYLIMSYEMLLASQLKRQLLVFNPRWILRFSSKGIILAFSIVAAALVVISVGKQPELDVGGVVGNVVDKYFTVRVNQEINEQMRGELTDEQIERLSAFGLDPTQFTYIESTDVFRHTPDLPLPQLSLKETVRNEVNKMLEPYQRFVNPLIAILIFGLMQFLGAIAFFLYGLTVEIIFWVAKKTGFLKIDKVPAEQEILHF